MTDTFILKLALSFLIGGLWITVASVAAERLGSKIGGVIAGLPSTAVVAFGGGTAYFALLSRNGIGPSPLSNNAFWPALHVLLPLTMKD